MTHPWEVTCPTLGGHMTHLERSQQFYRVPAHLFGETEVLPATQRTARFPLGNTAQKHSQPRTDTVRRIDLWTRGLGGEFSRELSKGQVPSVALGVPTPSLNPTGHYHPAIRSPLPPLGSNTGARCASTWRKCRQTRRPLWPEPTTAKIPLFFHP